ncbi:hypothetical protein C5S31_09965 [ANME-1 cluster archaeon GoMg2]|nr:hypothetical protein [ANME-1 cluster archaeon GoMg2]
MFPKLKNEVNVWEERKPKIRVITCLLVAMIFVMSVAPVTAYSIGLSKTTDKDTYCVGEAINYTLRVTNPDTVNCTLNVSDTYPNGTVEILDSSLFLEPGTNKTYQRSYMVQVVDVEPDKTVKNILNVEGTNAVGEVFSASVTKSSEIRSPLIAIMKTASLDGICPGSDPLTAYINDTVTYCFTVINNGDVNMTDITVTDDKLGPITLTETSLLPGGYTSGTKTYAVTDSDKPSITNNATVNATAEDTGLEVTDYDTCTVYVTTLDGFRVEKTASPTEGVNGTEINFTITVYNLRDAALSPVYINDSLPPELVFVSATDGGVHSSPWVNWSISTLAASSSKTVYLVARINVTNSTLGTLTNNVTVTGNSTGGIITNATTADVMAYSTAPYIVSVVQSSDSPVEGEDVNITAHVIDDLGVATVNLTYINHTNDATTVSMIFLSGTIFDGYWNVTIPGQPAGESLYITVTACDVAGSCTTTAPHIKHWSRDLSKLCPWNASRVFPVFPRYSTTPRPTTRTPAPPWYPHYPGNPLCRGVWG